MAHAAHHITQFQQLKAGEYAQEAETWNGMKQHIYVVADALTQMGYDDVTDVRQGKFFEVELSGSDSASAKARVTEMADKLLANPVIESYRVEIL